MLPCLAIATALCTVYLVTRKNEKSNPWQIGWIAVCVIWGIISCAMDPSQWNYSETTNWAIRGPITRGPATQLFTYFLAEVAILLVLSYLIGRILNAVVRNIIAKGQRSALPNGEKRLPDLPFRPTCYCCNQRKSFWTGYPSRICGQRICFDCLKELNWDGMSIDFRTAAREGKPPFKTADDVIAELRRRKNAAAKQ